MTTNATPTTSQEALGCVLGGFAATVLLTIVMPAERAKALRRAKALGLV